MIGPRYWTTGIKLRYVEPYSNHGPAWAAELDFFDDGFADDSAEEGRISTQGKLCSRYAVEGDGALRVLLDVLIRDATALGIEFQMQNLYWPGDVEPPPVQRDLIRAECERLGWRAGFLEPASRS